jgi:hypothetical protein
MSQSARCPFQHLAERGARRLAGLVLLSLTVHAAVTASPAPPATARASPAPHATTRPRAPAAPTASVRPPPIDAASPPGRAAARSPSPAPGPSPAPAPSPARSTVPLRLDLVPAGPLPLPPFAARLVEARNAGALPDLWKVWTGDRAFRREDLPFAANQAAFAADFTAWFGDRRARAPADYGRLLPVRSPVQNLDFRRLHVIAATVTVLLDAHDWRKDRGEYTRLLASALAFHREADAGMGTTPEVLCQLLSVSMLRLFAAQVVRHALATDPLEQECRALDARLREHFAALVPYRRTLEGERDFLLGATPEPAADDEGDLARVARHHRALVARDFDELLAIVDQAGEPRLVAKALAQYADAIARGLVRPSPAGEAVRSPGHSATLRVALPVAPAVKDGPARRAAAALEQAYRLRFAGGAFLPSVDGWLSGLALRAGARTVLELARHRRVRGTLPADLAALARFSAAPAAVDPFTGRPMIYRRSDRDFVLYSAGRDGTDDGGDRSRDVVIWPQGAGVAAR